jgi:hypothetical protein
MSNAPWVPLSQRGNPPAEPEVPYEGIPEHLAAPLWRWLERWERDPEEILLAFRIPQEAADDPWEDLGSATFDNEALWLDVVDFVLPMTASLRRNGPQRLSGFGALGSRWFCMAGCR